MDVLSRQETAEFAAFKRFVTIATDANPTLLRLDCLNPVKSLKPDFDTAHAPDTTLSDAWGKYLNVRGQKHFLSAGVRDSLQTIFEALNGRVVCIPWDVYPVYQIIAAKTGVKYVEYTSLPHWPPTFAVLTDTALITAPHAPTGQDLTPEEVHELACWLKAKPERRLIIDRVYDYANSNTIQPLVDTDQVFVCYSLSKTHLSPLVSGFTICPTDFNPPPITDPIVTLEGEQKAKVLLTRYEDYPKELQSRFAHRWRHLADKIKAVCPEWTPPPSGYLSIVPKKARDLLTQNVLAVPGNVYTRPDEFSVLTCLHETNAASDDKPVQRFYVTAASNFARGYDKYTRTYSKANIPESTYPDEFYVLKLRDIEIGIEKGKRLLEKTVPGDRLVILRTDVKWHELTPNDRTGKGEVIGRNHIRVDEVMDLKQRTIQVEDLYAESLALNHTLLPWSQVKPRSFSVLPIAQACQAKCEFCFSHSSVSDDQKQGKVVMGLLEEMCFRSNALGADRMVITGGGEPTLLAHNKLLEMIRVGRDYFPKVVLITNGYTLGNMDSDERLKKLEEYEAAGLTVLAISRHHSSSTKNTEIMGVNTHSLRIPVSMMEGREAGKLKGLSMRLICVLQKKGVHDRESLVRYLNFAAIMEVKEVCFKELYVAVGKESQYADSKYNKWSAENQVPLSLITDYMRENGAKKVMELPWGSPVYELPWDDTTVGGGVITLRVAAYTEPSVFWERANGVCRSWNLMADGTCYANLETPDSRVQLPGDPIPLVIV